MSDDLKLRTASIETPEGAIVIRLCEAFRQASLTVGLDATDPQTALYLATASAMFCGTQFGMLEIIGAMLPQDQRRFVESMATNIRQGIKVGRNRAVRVERELGYGGLKQ